MQQLECFIQYARPWSRPECKTEARLCSVVNQPDLMPPSYQHQLRSCMYGSDSNFRNI